MPLTAAAARLEASFIPGASTTMTDQTNDRRSSSWWRWPLWGGAAALLSVPAIAMAMKAPGVDWSPADFVIMGALLAATAGAVEVGMRASRHWAYRLAAVGSIGGAFLLTWADLAVGLLGPEGGWANRLLLLVPLLGVVGAIAARFRPRGMALVMLAVLAAQLAVGAFALTEPPTTKGFGWPWHILAVSAFFGGGWLLAAGLFRKAAADEAPTSPSPAPR
ncbi:MAG: hypothetical protein K0R83_537 [Caulobacter sp.]|jgi:hypothetical protein|nr:hypothetical protein [Caulobacter sp.]